MAKFPSLAGFEPTKQTLHLYSKAIASVPRANAAALPHWQHIALAVRDSGLETVEMPLPDGQRLALFMDLNRHDIEIRLDGEIQQAFDMRAGKTGSQMGEAILGAVGELGLSGKYEGKRYADEAVRAYEVGAAEAIFGALKLAADAFEQHRKMLEGEVGGVNFWTHGFDMSVEWYGSKQVPYEEGGETRYFPAQLNLGFSFGEPNHPAPYFYSNPWPLDKGAFFNKPLPEGARWFSKGWEGSILPYAEVEGDERGEERLLEYAQAVYQLARPTLMA